MIKVKNMLCIVLALAMMLIPLSVSAAPADGYRVAMHLSADNTTVAPGDSITLSLTVDVDDWESYWGLPAFYLMYNDAIFAPASDFKTNKTSLRMPVGDLGEYLKPTGGASNTITSSNYTAVSKKFETAGESADDYTGGVAVTFAANTDNGYTTAGGIQFTDADTVQMEFYLNVDANATPGTYKVGLPYAAYLANKAYFNCCDTGKAVRVSSSAIDVSDAVVEITVANETPELPELTVAGLKQQIKFGNDETFSYRVIADLSNFAEVFGDVAGATGEDDGTYITEAGFIYNKGAAVDQDAALAQINGGTVTYPGKQHQKSAYISTTAVSGKYVMACVVYNIPDADVASTLSVLAYVKYVQDGVEKVALCDAYTGTFEALYNQYK